MIPLIAFAFKNTIAEKVLYQLTFEHSYVIQSDRKEIINFVKHISLNAPQFIIGIGEYSGRDRELIRIETMCSNKFRNTISGDSLEKVRLHTFLKPGKHSKYATGIGNSYCNFVSYEIMRKIRDCKLPTRYNFLHIPKEFDSQMATQEITSLISFLKD